MKQATCAERVSDHMESTLDDLRQLFEAWCKGDEDVEDLGNLYDYGLSFDYVAPETFNNQPEGYFRYQLSWGGPSDEFRVFADQISEYRWSIYRIEYWFLDWFDGAYLPLHGEDYTFMEELLQSFFVESGSFDHEYERAMEE